jgi:hypothetical protein
MPSAPLAGLYDSMTTQGKRFGATTVLALARAAVSDPIDSQWISMMAGLISPAGDVGFVREDFCEASHVHGIAAAREAPQDRGFVCR